MAKRKKRRKRTFYFFPSFRGLPRGRMECSSLRRFAVCFCQDSAPYGRSRFTPGACSALGTHRKGFYHFVGLPESFFKLSEKLLLECFASPRRWGYLVRPSGLGMPEHPTEMCSCRRLTTRRGVLLCIALHKRRGRRR